MQMFIECPLCARLYSRHLERHIPDTSMNESDQILPWQDVGSNEPVGGARRHGLSRVLPVLPPQALSQPKEARPVRVSSQGNPEPTENILGFLVPSPHRQPHQRGGALKAGARQLSEHTVILCIRSSVC